MNNTFSGRTWSRIVLAGLLAAMLASCGTAAGTSATPVPAPAATSTASGSALAAIPQSRTAEGYHVLGRADAPVTITFYSDFF